MARITIPKPKHVPHTPDKPAKTPMPDKQTWQECQIYETKGIIDEVQSCRCPVCNKYLTTPFRYYFDYYKYCPNCGTRLYREGEEDGTD